MPDLRAKVGSLELATPVIAAAGTYGYGVEYDGLVDWSMVGAVSVKGLSTAPARGHPAVRMAETAAGMLNAIGLQNIGVEAFARDKLPRLARVGTRIIANCWGNVAEEYESVVARLDELAAVDAIELNLSSPNKREWGRPPATSASATREIVGRARKRSKKPMWVKLSPDVTDIGEIAKAAEDAGADALAVANTFKGMAIDVRSRRPVLANTTGGLSGPAIKPLALYRVFECCRAVQIPVVGGGGIMSGSDAMEYLVAGAVAVQVGTANLFDPSAPSRIAGEIARVLDELGHASIAEVISTLEIG